MLALPGGRGKGGKRRKEAGGEERGILTMPPPPPYASASFSQSSQRGASKPHRPVLSGVWDALQRPEQDLRGPPGSGHHLSLPTLSAVPSPPNPQYHSLQETTTSHPPTSRPLEPRVPCRCAKHQITKINHFKPSSSVACSTFTMLYSHHLSLVPKRFHQHPPPPKKNT